MAFGLGLPPHKYVLAKLGSELRGVYDHVVADSEPEHLQPLIERLRQRR